MHTFGERPMPPVTTKAQIQYIRLEVLSPVHIGSGSALSPLDYQVHQDDNGEHILYTLDYTGWLDTLTDDEAQSLANIFSQSTLTKVWETVRKKIDKEVFCLAKSKTSKSIYNNYLNRLKTDESKNELAPATRNSLYANMIIPGSSLKGAMRTAVISKLDNGELKESKNRQDQQFTKWFGNITENAFQALKVSDLELLPTQSQFVEAEERKLKNDSTGAPKSSCEVAPHGTVLYGRLMFGRNTKEAKGAKTPLSPWNFEVLRDACNAHYTKHFEAERKKFYSKPHFAETLKISDSIFQKFSTAPEAMLLRVGHFSHIECVTVENNEPQPRFHGTTRTHADGQWPFGWVLIHPCTAEEYTLGMEKHEQDKAAILEDWNIKRQAYTTNKVEAYKHQKALTTIQMNERQAQNEAKLKAKATQDANRLDKKEKKETRRQEQDAQKKAIEEHLASLPPHERAIEKTLSGTATNEEVLKAFEQIESYSSPVRLAKAIKEFWFQKDKWSGKKLKKRQLERVEKIKKILSAQ